MLVITRSPVVNSWKAFPWAGRSQTHNFMFWTEAFSLCRLESLGKYMLAETTWRVAILSDRSSRLRSLFRTLLRGRQACVCTGLETGVDFSKTEHSNSGAAPITR